MDIVGTARSIHTFNSSFNVDKSISLLVFDFRNAVNKVSSMMSTHFNGQFP